MVKCDTQKCGEGIHDVATKDGRSNESRSEDCAGGDLCFVKRMQSGMAGPMQERVL